jgi:hypothetical protein
MQSAASATWATSSRESGPLPKNNGSQAWTPTFSYRNSGAMSAPLGQQIVSYSASEKLRK